VLDAAEQGTLGTGRLKSYHKLRRELDYLERKKDVRAALEEKRRWRSIIRDYKRNFRK
jgi:ribosome biogenesis GTPase